LMAKKKLRPWTKEDVRTLKRLARERTKTTVIARSEAERRSDVSASNETWSDAWGRSKEERGVMAGLGSFRRRVIKFLTLQKQLFRTDCFERVIVKPQDGPGAAASRLHPSF
jgi:hypothetical protein